MNSSKLKLCILAGVGAVLMTGCASIIHGTTQKIGISSSPTGAAVSVDNKAYGNTPLFADLKRGEEHIITIEVPGYEKTQLTVTKKLSGWVWGNILFGGLIGLGVDAMTGGLYDLTPEQLSAEMKKSGSTVSMGNDGIIVVAVLSAEPEWKRVGSLVHQQ